MQLWAAALGRHPFCLEAAAAALAITAYGIPSTGRAAGGGAGRVFLGTGGGGPVILGAGFEAGFLESRYRGGFSPRFGAGVRRGKSASAGGTGGGGVGGGNGPLFRLADGVGFCCNFRSVHLLGLGDNGGEWRGAPSPFASRFISLPSSVSCRRPGAPSPSCAFPVAPPVPEALWFD